LRQEHEVTHVGGYRCTVVNCQYPPFPSAKSLKNHTANVHTANQVPKSIRRVGQLHGLIKPPSTKNSATRQRLTEQNNPGAASVSAQTATNDSTQHHRIQIDQGYTSIYQDSNAAIPGAVSAYTSLPKSSHPKDQGSNSERVGSFLLKEWEQELDHLFQREEFVEVLQTLEWTLASVKKLPAALSSEERVKLLPPGVPDYIIAPLLNNNQADFIQILEQACERARKKIRTEKKKALALSLPVDTTRIFRDGFPLYYSKPYNSSYQPLSTGKLPGYYEIEHDLVSGGQPSSFNVDSGHRGSETSGPAEAEEEM
jgi:hypothetical protein